MGLPDGRSIDYLVDSLNRRVAKKVNGAVVRKWIYEDQLKPAAEFDGAGSLLARYVNGVIMKAGTSYRVVADHLGTPRLVVHSTTGAVAQRLDVDEWGQVTTDTGVGFQVLGFGGGIYDTDTGLVRLGLRDYDPFVGRWTAKDPIGLRESLNRGDGEDASSVEPGEPSDANLYGYVLGDPVNWVDPSGRVAVAAAAIPVGEAIGVGAAIIAVWAMAKWAEWERTHPRYCPPPPPPCPPCPEPPPPVYHYDHPHYPCPGAHWHYFTYNQAPDCTCYLQKKLGGCL